MALAFDERRLGGDPGCAGARVNLATLDPNAILYEDDVLLAVDKPAGLVSHATVDPKRDHLVAMVTRMLIARDGEVGQLAQHHRLDRDTSGLVLFSRSSAVDAAVGASFAEHRITKTYLAVVRGSSTPVPTEPLVIDEYLAPGKGAGGRTLVVRSGGRPARTSVRALHVSDPWVLVQAQPLTGRTHQIRVHLAHRGWPIVGDPLYGPSEPDAPRMLLHALRLEFAHPLTGAPLSIVAPVPRAFRSCIVGLAADGRIHESPPDQGAENTNG